MKNYHSNEKNNDKPPQQTFYTASIPYRSEAKHTQAEVNCL